MEEKETTASQPILNYERAVSPDVLKQYGMGYALSTALVFAAFASLIHGLHGEASFYAAFPFALAISTRAIYLIWRTARKAETVISAHVKVIVLLWIAGVMVGGFGTWSMLTSVDPHVGARRHNGCRNNLQNMGLLMIYVFAPQHQGQFPQSIADLTSLPNGNSRPEIFICPAIPGRSYARPTSQQAIQQFAAGGTPDYIYRGNGLTLSSPPSAVLAHDRLPNHALERIFNGINVLYVNGDIESLTPKQAELLIKELDAGHNPPRAEMVK